METNGNIKWDDDRIDDLARKAFSGQKFTYDPSFFSEVEKMLPKEKKRRVFGYWWLAILPAVLLIGYLVWPVSDKGQVQLTENGVVYAPTDNGEKIEIEEKLGEEELTQETPGNEKEVDEKKMGLTDQVAPINGGKKWNKPVKLVRLNPKNQTSSEEVRRNLEEVLQLNIKVNETGRMQSIIPLGIAENPSLAKNDERPEEVKAGLMPIQKTEFTERPIMSIVPMKEYQVGRIEFKGLNNVTTYAMANEQFSPFKYRTRTNHAIFVQAGLGMGSARSEGNTTLVKTGMLGFGYQIQKGYWGASIGFLGEVEKTEIELEERTNHYSYDLSTFENKLNYTNFYRADFPIMLQFKSDKHQVHFGSTFQWFLHSEMNYEFLKNGVSERSGIVTGEKYGLRTMNLQLAAGYGFYLTKNVMLGGNFAYQVMNPIKNTEIAKTVVSPYSGQIFIRHLIRQRR